MREGHNTTHVEWDYMVGVITPGSGLDVNIGGRQNTYHHPSPSKEV